MTPVKRKPGRPPRADRVASVRFEVRLTEPEATRWQRAADKQGITLAQWVREACEMAWARGSSR